MSKAGDPVAARAELRQYKASRERILRGFRKWLEASLGMSGVAWDWDKMREHEQARFGSEEVFEEVVKFAQGRPSIIDGTA